MYKVEPGEEDRNVACVGLRGCGIDVRVQSCKRELEFVQTVLNGLQVEQVLWERLVDSAVLSLHPLAQDFSLTDVWIYLDLRG